ncbi:adhesion G-protein coupled receptor G7-like isoform X7 [Clavelina lepadiformis]|uniref:adhesion G-protein coupled receptor G7-like isoform X7 n=1 Tax=Clavelina lepadiformis TaxID=159417 RepID=UPI00404330E5
MTKMIALKLDFTCFVFVILLTQGSAQNTTIFEESTEATETTHLITAADPNTTDAITPVNDTVTGPNTFEESTEVPETTTFITTDATTLDESTEALETTHLVTAGSSTADYTTPIGANKTDTTTFHESTEAAETTHLITDDPSTTDFLTSAAGTVTDPTTIEESTEAQETTFNVTADQVTTDLITFAPNTFTGLSTADYTSPIGTNKTDTTTFHESTEAAETTHLITDDPSTTDFLTSATGNVTDPTTIEESTEAQETTFNVTADTTVTALGDANTTATTMTTSGDTSTTDATTDEESMEVTETTSFITIDITTFDESTVATGTTNLITNDATTFEDSTEATETTNIFPEATTMSASGDNSTTDATPDEESTEVTETTSFITIDPSTSDLITSAMDTFTDSSTVILSTSTAISKTDTTVTTSGDSSTTDATTFGKSTEVIETTSSVTADPSTTNLITSTTDTFTESTILEGPSTDFTTSGSTTATTTATNEQCDQDCDGCASCGFNMDKCVCKCIIGYQLTGNGKCDPIFCQQSTLMYPNSVDLINVTFPQTQAGFQNQSSDKCPPNTSNPGKPYGTRSCNVDGTWNQPKWISSCNTTAEDYTNVSFNSTEARQEAADNLEILTSSPDNLTLDEVLSTVEALNNVADAETLNNETSSAIVDTIGNLLNVPEEQFQQSGQAENLLQTLDSVGEKVELDEGETFQEVNSRVAVAVVRPTSKEAEKNFGFQYTSLSIPDELGFRSDQLITFFDSPSVAASSYIQVPPDALQDTSDNRVSFYAFPDDKLFQATDTREIYTENNILGSDVVLSATVVNATEPVSDLNEPVVMKFSLNANVASNTTLEGKCVFWNETGNGFWSNAGLLSQNFTNLSAECRFKHLTNFATLFSVIPVDTTPLDLITIIGSSISSFSLIILLTTFIFVRKMRTKGKFRSAFLLVNLGIALLILNISLIISEVPSLPTPSTGCTALAVIIHFALLSSLAWMMVEGVNIYIAVVHVMYARARINNRRIVSFSILWGWLMPAIFVAIVAAVNIENYTRNDSECWLSVDVEIYLIAIPAAVILGINLILYVVIFARVVCFRELNANKNHRADTRKNVLLSLILFTTLGGTWLIAFPMLATQNANEVVSTVFAYIFSILTALQGFFLFLLYVVRQYFTVDLFKDVARKSFSKLTSPFSNWNTATSATENYQIPRPGLVLESRSASTEGEASA